MIGHKGSAHRVFAHDGRLAATPIRSANIVVVLNSSDHDHYAVSGEIPYREAAPPWATPTFLTDQDLGDALGTLLDSRTVDAVVFGSNALNTAVARRAASQPSFVKRWSEDGVARDVGVLVLHQYLRPDDVLPLEFLGTAEFSLVGIEARRIAEGDICFDRDWRFVSGGSVQEQDKRFLELARGYGPGKNGVWSRFEFKYQTEWDALAWEGAGEDGRIEQSLLAVCTSGGRVVAASRVPIDLTRATALLGSLLAACLRPRGCVLVEAPEATSSSTFTTALASAIDNDHFIHRERPASASDLHLGSTPFSFFDEVIVAPEWRVDTITSLDEETVLRKLEQGGSIVATFAGPGEQPVAVRLSGEPQYASRARALARWVLERLPEFARDIWGMRALAEAAAAANEAFVDRRLVPEPLRQEFLRRHLREHLLARVANDNVDDNVLATTNTYAALRALGVHGLEGMRTWVDAHLDEEMPSVIAQALTLVPDLSRADRRATLEAALGAEAPSDDDPRLLRAHAATLFAESHPSLLVDAASDRSLGFSVQAELLRAVVRHQVPASAEIVDLATRVRDRIARLAAGEGALEPVCIGNAALIELSRQQGIAPHAAVEGRPREVDARVIANTELAREHQVAVQDALAAREEAERYRQFGRRAVTAFVGLLVAATALMILAIAIWSPGMVAAKFGFAAGVFGVMSVLIRYVIKRASAFGIPPLLSSERETERTNDRRTTPSPR